MEQSQNLPAIRRRVNISTSVRGIQTADATIEITNLMENGQGQEDSDAFKRIALEYFAWVNETWPPPLTEIKGG
jgi:hypothetical protein